MLTGSIRTMVQFTISFSVGKLSKIKGNSAPNGSILIASGEAMELISQGGSTEVELSKVIPRIFCRRPGGMSLGRNIGG